MPANWTERRVVITGLGVVTPIGNDTETFWKNLVAGQCGIDRISFFDPTPFDTQIAGQVKKAYEAAQQHASAGSFLHALFPHARQVARRVRSETGIAKGHVSVSSVAVDYVRQVFDHFGDKTVLVIGAGKMGELTLKHLRELQPRKIDRKSVV